MPCPAQAEMELWGPSSSACREQFGGKLRRDGPRTEDDADGVVSDRIDERNLALDPRSVELDRPDAARHPLRILDDNFDSRLRRRQHRLIPPPVFRNARIDAQRPAVQRQAEQLPHTSLAEARTKAKSALHAVDHGSDPATQKAAERNAETFAELAREYAERHAKFKRSGREDLRLRYGSPHKRKTGKRPHEPIVNP
jgi:multidrug efflux pump subunit AcrA (membrane-fusion protein)